jgi:uracil-DNA glycosylase
MRTIVVDASFDSWHLAARALLREGVPPAEVEFRDAAPGEGPTVTDAPYYGARVPRQFFAIARQVAEAHDPRRWQAIYEALWRLTHGEHDLLANTRDPSVRWLNALAAQARRHAQEAEQQELLELEQRSGGAAPFVPAGAGLDELREAAKRCTGCELYRHASQVVFGRGPSDARVVMVGEQPGDQEDLKGAPFVGPAGEVLDRALREAGVERERVYVTNAVKHFKFVERGKRRIHQTPRLAEIAACQPWLEAEIGLIRPEILVALGATAARAIFGPDFRLLKQRGQFLPSRFTPKSLATLHPSAVLRGQDDADKERLYGMLLEDLRVVAAAA